MSDERTIDVSVMLPRDAPAMIDATVHVQLLDVTLADAPSVKVAEEIRPVRELRPGARLDVRLSVPAADISEKAQYTVRVHIDVAGDGRVSKGDCVSTQSYPVLTYGNPSSAAVLLKYIG